MEFQATYEYSNLSHTTVAKGKVVYGIKRDVLLLWWRNVVCMVRTLMIIKWRKVVLLPPCRLQGGGELSLIFHFDTRWGWVVSVTSRLRFAPGKGPPSPIGYEAGWASELIWTQEKSLSSSIVRHCTDWATPAPDNTSNDESNANECEISSSHGGEYHPWWWRQYASLKRRSTIILHGSIYQKTTLTTIQMKFASQYCSPVKHYLEIVYVMLRKT
jgi:hypothetical protein